MTTTDDASNTPASPDQQKAPDLRASGPDSGGGRTRRPSLGGLGRDLGLVLALAALLVLGVATSGERFLSVSNLMVILQQAAIIGVISIGVTFVITSGGIDLSVGSVMGLSTVWASTLATQTMAQDTHWIIMVLTAVLVGTAAGTISGIIVAYGGVVSFIATLAMLVAARGLAEIISDRRTQIVQVDGFLDTFRGNILGIPVIVWIFVLVALAGWFLLNRTTFGRRTVAIGGNPEAARLAGIKIRLHTVMVFALSGMTAGIAGVMMLARTTAGSSTNGYLYELDAIAAVVVGGTLLIGGRGTIVGTVLGVLIFATLTNIFIQNNLSISVQALAKGAIIVGAVLLQQRFAARSRSS